MSLLTEETAAAVKAELRLRVAKILYQQWFAEAEILACDAERLELGVQNRFFKNRIESSYLDVVADACEAALGRRVRVEVSISPRLLARFREEQEKWEAEAATLELDAAPALAPPVPEKSRRGRHAAGQDLDPEFTFANFAVGSSNRLSYAVAMRMLEEDGEFQRVFFCGQHGVGKTHLLQAICREARERRPGSVVTYVTCEKFVADFVAAHAAGKRREFRASYGDCDVLALDQLHELGQGNKAATQTELLGILDELQARGRKVIMASTLAPNELDGLEPRLRDRLGAGFVDKLSLPDEELRKTLLSRKLAARGVSLPEPLMTMAARELTGNVRRLEGVVNRLAALLGMAGMEPTPVCVRMAMQVETPVAPRTALTVADIVAAVGEEYGFRPEAITGRGRTAALCGARQIAVVLSRRLLGVRYVELGAIFGRRSHATIMSIVRDVNPELFSSGVAGRGVERILFRLGVGMKPEEVLEHQRKLF